MVVVQNEPLDISDRDADILRDLAGWRARDGWVRPLDIGGHSGSDISRRLNRMARLGLVYVRTRNGGPLATAGRTGRYYQATYYGRVCSAAIEKARQDARAGINSGARRAGGADDSPDYLPPEAPDQEANRDGES